MKDIEIKYNYKGEQGYAVVYMNDDGKPISVQPYFLNNEGEVVFAPSLNSTELALEYFQGLDFELVHGCRKCFKKLNEYLGGQ